MRGNSKNLIPGHCYRMHGIYTKIHSSPTKKPESIDFIGIFMGKEEGFDCIICDHGSNCPGFNVYQGDLEHPTKKDVEDYIGTGHYETFTFGWEHMPDIVEEIL